MDNGVLHGVEPKGTKVRWIQSIVPIIFISFMIPGIVYGISVGSVRREKDVTELLVGSMKSMASVIVVYFFAAQFIEYFKYTNLGRMMSIVGGQYLATTEVSTETLLALFVVLTMFINLLMSSMSAKYGVMSPIFVPMFMLLGVSPELTQAGYRVGDSVTNNLAPLNPYQVIILKEMQKYSPKAGMGTLISANLPYSIFFAIVWIGLLLLWMNTNTPLGQGGPIHYVPAN
jgi:aminobenzoyl-glutamate transport protein